MKNKTCGVRWGGCERQIEGGFPALQCEKPCVLAAPAATHRFCRCAKHQAEVEKKRKKPIKPGWKFKKQKSIQELEEEKKDLEVELDRLNKIIRGDFWYKKYSKKGSK